MDTTQLKMVIDAVNSLGGSAQTAFYVWVIINNLGLFLIWLIVVGGILLLAKMILRGIKESDDAEKLLRMLRENLEFSSYEQARMIAYIVDNVKPRKKYGEQ